MNRSEIMMKRLFVTLVALSIVGTVLAQGVPPPVPDAPSALRFRAPVGVQYLPEAYAKDHLREAPFAVNQKVYQQAQHTYQAAMRKRPTLPKRPPVDCAMIGWVDTTATAPMPTLMPNPNVDPTMPTLTPNGGCAPPTSLKRLPDSLRTPPLPPKKYPMKVPRQ